MLLWLDSWPAGLKLNTELSHFYSRSFVFVIVHWGGKLEFFFCYSDVSMLTDALDCLDFMRHTFKARVPLIDTPLLAATIYTLGLASCGGVTILISICADLLSIATAHLYICYLVTNTIYSRMLETAGSLWNLFRGIFSSSSDEQKNLI